MGAKKSRPRASTAAVAERKRQRLLAQLPDLRHILRGSLVTRYRRCGQPTCRCARDGDPGHGPAYYLMVTVPPGKTVQVYVPKEHKDEVKAWLDNFQRAREKLDEISTLNRDLLKQGRLFNGG